MSEPFVAEIRIFPFSFPPKNWAWCNGQILSIAQNSGLFSLVGNIYGGDGKTTFALPNLQGRAPMHPGTSSTPGAAVHKLGETGGTTTETLTEKTMAAHRHPWNVYAGELGEDRTPENRALARVANAYGPVGDMKPMYEQALPPVGGGQPHTNMQPFLATYFSIALAGVMPVHP